ncbi:hypothetical protein N7508_003527 [Penicillium antarcticum]|uniref:uncharacterized protein n=1 Tax=Penicillium antarcticum TaxID=416450 RepID=UPI0023995CA6|nr:uncharacterized protein N7508_003527 [Penicillium antarcticum]KAJ5312697.1 hypothetical protein N7508_003527 [Penicillium antarcticum]
MFSVSRRLSPLKRMDGTPVGNRLPVQLIKAVEWTKWIEEDDEDIRLLGFGEKRIFTDYFNYRVDFLRIGCTYPGEDEVLLFQMIGFVEELLAE